MDVEATRARLLRERAASRAQRDRADASFDDIVSAARDSNLDDEHDPEGPTIAVERSLASALGTTARERLAHVDAALERLAAGTYGVCEHCGRRIDPARLDALPATATCVDCG